MTSGVDDLISRGNGPVRLDDRYGAYFDTTSPRLGDWQFSMGGYLFEQGIEDYSGWLQFVAAWYPTEKLTLRLDLLPQYSEDWLLWERDNLFGSYRAERLDLDFRLDWIPSPRHELRIKWQWIGINAEPRDAISDARARNDRLARCRGEQEQDIRNTVSRARTFAGEKTHSSGTPDEARLPPSRQDHDRGSACHSSTSSNTQNDQWLWIPPIHKTISTEGKGFGELAEAIARHHHYLHKSGDWAARDRARLERDLATALQEALIGRFMENVQKNKYEEIVQQVFSRRISPHEAVDALLNWTSSHP